MARKPLKVAAWVLGSVAGLLALLTVAVLVIGNTDAGRALIERITARLTGGMVNLSGLGGSFPAQLTLRKLELTDKQGVWLTADGIALTWTPLALLERRISVDSLEVAHLDMERTPHSEGSGGSASVPHIEVRRFVLEDVRLGAELAGRAARVSLRGGMDLRSLESALADVTARRIDGDGDYVMHLRFDSKRMDGTLAVHEPASGPLENILKLPGLGALDANLSISGPHEAELIDLKLTAGQLHAAVAGRIDLHQGSMDLNYSLDAPAVAPRPDLTWQRLSLTGQWHGTLKDPTADGHLQADGLTLPGDAAIAALRADLAAGRGTISLRGAIDGLRIPGPQAALFEKDPVRISASMRVADDTRPLTVEATHRLLSVKAQAITAGRPSVALVVQVPDVAPFAQLAGEDVRGDANIKAQIDFRESDIGVTLDSAAGLSGGSAPWIHMLGNRVVLKVSGAMSDKTFTLDRAEIDAPSLTLTASGTAARPTSNGAGANPPKTPLAAADAYVQDIKARWDLKVSDLGILRPELAGSMQASGALDGAPSSFNGDAEMKSTLSIRGSAPGAVAVELHARGLPSMPSASVDVRGNVDGSPLTLSASLQRNGRKGFEGSIRRGDWKSARADGEMSMSSSIDDARGHVHLEVGQLADLDRLLGIPLQGALDGAVDFTPRAGHTRAKFQLDAKELSAGRFSGTIHLAGEGDTASVAAQLHVQSPNLAGFPAELSATAVVNLDTHRVRMDQATVDYRGQKVGLLSAARISYADGLKVDELKLGAQDAILQIEGEVLPTLDAHASLQHINPKLIGVFVPDLISEGSIEGNARLQGSLSAPTGRVSLNAHDIRFASDEALGLPALNLTANADLAGDTASLDVRLSAGKASLFTMTGKTPLDAAGEYDLKLNGKLDLSVANPLFEARGMHVGGDLAVDANVAGKLDTPQITGAVKLASGNFRDYVRGINLTAITAEVDGSEGTLQIKTFKATAAAGSVSMSGSIGALQPKIPLDLQLTATKAQLVTSALVTANVNADLSVKGTALERLAVAGTIHVNRAVIGIPDSLPPDVAVLDVRRRGKHAQVAAAKRLEVGLDVSVDAPREILVQGRGLDAELGGSLRIRGTTDAPLVSGPGFDLMRGTFSLAGSTLTFDNTSRVSFDGAGLKKSNLDPTLDFTATSTVQNTTVKLQISGYADAPKFDFSSTTGLAQDEIMALLLFGQPAAQLTALQVAQVGAALATLSGVGGSGSNPLTKVQKALGLDRLNVGTNTVPTATGGTETQGAAIQAGRYIFKRVYVEGKQTTTGTSQVQVQVDLTKHLKLQTRLGNGTAIQGTTPDNDPGSSIGLLYQIEY
ncbi:MAG: translocation/assembly module TamB domain-containing protein [Steroidobacteraceae bacterium]|jgi:translocation and assembly module TamB